MLRIEWTLNIALASFNCRYSYISRWNFRQKSAHLVSSWVATHISSTLFRCTIPTKQTETNSTEDFTLFSSCISQNFLMRRSSLRLQHRHTACTIWAQPNDPLKASWRSMRRKQLRAKIPSIHHTVAAEASDYRFEIPINNPVKKLRRCTHLRNLDEILGILLHTELRNSHNLKR